MAICYLGIGTNLGNREQNISTALKKLKQHSIAILDQSSIIETQPVGGPDQGMFLNGVIKVETSLEPYSLLNTLKNIEKTMGRVKTIVNGPRIIDLDILLYDSIEIQSETLTIPHPRMHEREFVLEPLKELTH